MNVQMVYLLTSFVTGIAEQSKTAFRKGIATLLQGQLGRQHHHAPHQGRMLRAEMGQGGNMELGNHQKMNRGPRVDVMKDEYIVILVHHPGRYFASNNFTE